MKNRRASQEQKRYSFNLSLTESKQNRAPNLIWFFYTWSWNELPQSSTPDVGTTDFALVSFNFLSLLSWRLLLSRSPTPLHFCPGTNNHLELIFIRASSSIFGVSFARFIVFALIYSPQLRVTLISKEFLSAFSILSFESESSY